MQILRAGLLCLWSIILSFSGISWGQSNIGQGGSFKGPDDFLNGFSEDGRIKVLLLTLAPSGMTETAAEQIAKAIELNLVNTNHFTVVGPSEWSSQLQARDPNLADCHDIACGVVIGKLFNADKVLVGRIQPKTVLDENADELEGFELSIRLLDVPTNTTDFSDEAQFTDETMQDELFHMAGRVSANTLLKGHVVSTSKYSVIIDWGRIHGLKEGDQLVIYQLPLTVVNLEGQTLGLRQKKIAIAQIHLLDDATAEAIILQELEPALPGYLVQTYIDRPKQIGLISSSRRELDTQKRLIPRKRIVLEAETIVEETGKEKWEQRMALAEEDKRFWSFITIGGIVTTLLVVYANPKISFLGDLNPLIPLSFGGFTAYGVYRYVKARQRVDNILGEGRSKGFMASTQWYWDPHHRQVGFATHF